MKIYETIGKMTVIYIGYCVFTAVKEVMDKREDFVEEVMNK